MGRDRIPSIVSGKFISPVLSNIPEGIAGSAVNAGYISFNLSETGKDGNF
jgi:hypothetical protein